MSFATHLEALGLAGLAATSYETSDVDRALSLEPGSLRWGDVAALISDAAVGREEELAARAQTVTLQRFGRAVRLFAPLYLSNHCLSSCTYCGFSKGLEVPRRTLTVDEVVREAKVLADRGFRSILLVAGEHRLEVSPDHLIEAVRAVLTVVPQVSIETQTWSREVYESLVAAGCEGVVHYQETYDRETYAATHLAGWKRNPDRRLLAMDAAGEAGARRLGVGALLGLAPDWRHDVLAVGAHAQWLQHRHWRSEITVALPRMQTSAAGEAPAVLVDDAAFVRSLCALRLALPEVGQVLSTRERPALRDGLARICITTMSAGSSTAPGGYEVAIDQGGEQFDISDERSPAVVAEMLVTAGYEPVFKDAFPLTADA
jgi:2-iminoacetate synthase